MRAPTSGPTTIIQKSGQASGHHSAGPKLRAGLTEQLSTGIPTILTRPSARPIATPAKLPEPFLGIGGSENHKNKEEGKQALDYESHTGIGTGLENVGGQIAVARDSAELKSGSHIDHPEKEAGTDSCAYQLRDHITTEFAELHTSAQPHGKRNSRIDMAAGNIADAIHQAQQNQTETEADTERPDFGPANTALPQAGAPETSFRYTPRDIFS